MLFVNYDIHAGRAELMSSLAENDRIVEQEKYDTSKGVPKIHIKEKCDKIKITCTLTGGATKDNGFLEGTYFVGRLVESDGITALRGIILTAPIYHAILAIIFGLFIYQCISLGGFNPVPVVLLIFSIFMFRDEFKKQKIIKRYIFRAFKNTFAKISEKNK